MMMETITGTPTGKSKLELAHDALSPFRLLPTMAQRATHLHDIHENLVSDQRLFQYRGVYHKYGQDVINGPPFNQKLLGPIALQNSDGIIGQPSLHIKKFVFNSSKKK